MDFGGTDHALKTLLLVTTTSAPDTSSCWPAGLWATSRQRWAEVEFLGDHRDLRVLYVGKWDHGLSLKAQLG